MTPKEFLDKKKMTASQVTRERLIELLTEYKDNLIMLFATGETSSILDVNSDGNSDINSFKLSGK